MTLSERRNFTEIMQEFHIKQLNFTEKRRKQKKKILHSLNHLVQFRFPSWCTILQLKRFLNLLILEKYLFIESRSDEDSSARGFRRQKQEEIRHVATQGRTQRDTVSGTIYISISSLPPTGAWPA
jgi:hypothetical protein